MLAEAAPIEEAGYKSYKEKGLKRKLRNIIIIGPSIDQFACTFHFKLHEFWCHGDHSLCFKYNIKYNNL